mgnify:FL=1
MTRLPPLPYESWIPTRIALHLRLQILGKIRMALRTGRNHWWHVPLYVSARGMTTRAMPCSEDRLLEIEFDVLDDVVELRTSDGQRETVAVRDGQTIQAFYRDIVGAMKRLKISNPIATARPFDAPSTHPFDEDTEHDAYDGDAVRRFWRAMTQIQPVFQQFQGRWVGKDTPVHLFWHSLDLAYTRFSGREAPALPEADPVTQEAYSHEVISFGFWAGDDTTPEAGFYSYTYPEPDGLSDERVRPNSAAWRTGDSGTLAFLSYDAVRTAEDPEAALTAFLTSTYEAGAQRADWPDGLVRTKSAHGAGTQT